LRATVFQLGYVGAEPSMPTVEPTKTTPLSPVKENSESATVLLVTWLEKSTPLPPVYANVQFTMDTLSASCTNSAAPL